MMINRKVKQRVSGKKESGCQRHSITVFCYDDMLRKGYYSTEFVNGMDRYYYKDWPLRDVTIDLYYIKKDGSKILYDTQKTNSNGYVTFTGLNMGNYTVELSDKQFTYALWDHIFPNSTNTSIEVSKYTPTDYQTSRGWYYDAMCRLPSGTPNGNCLDSSNCNWINGVWSCCVCGNLMGYSLSNYYNTQNYICGYRTTNPNAYTYVGNYGGLRVKLDPSELDQHILAFDVSWKCYNMSSYGSYYYSSSYIENGLVFMYNGSTSYPFAQCMRSGPTGGSTDQFSMKIANSGSLGSMEMIDIVAACHIGCTYCSNYQKYSLGVETAISYLMLYMSIQSH